MTFYNFSSLRPSLKVVAYIATTFGYAIMHNIFSFYYVKMFLNHFHVSPYWFQLSQIIFMAWNTVNDPLFGYFQDNSNMKIFKIRRLSVLYGAPFYALSFLVAWFPFGQYNDSTSPWVIGLHLISALCLYDTLFTFVLLAHCALFAEMQLDYKSRLNMKWWSVVTSLCAGVAVPIANHTSDNLACLPCFRITCVCIAIVSMLCMIFTGLYATTVYEDSSVIVQDKHNHGNFFKLTKEILSERDFHGFVWLNFLQQGHSVFQNNFTSIFIDFLAPGNSTHFLNIYFTLLWTLPSLFVILFRSFIERVGYYRIVRVACYSKILTSSLVWMWGPTPYVFLGYLLVDNIILHATSNLYDIVLADIVDNDRRLYQRKQPISSMIFASNALITKPAISLFPMLVVALLNNNGYQATIKSLHTVPTTSMLDTNLSAVIFNLACGLPLIVGLLQLVSWSFFNLRSSHCKSVAVPDCSL